MSKHDTWNKKLVRRLKQIGFTHAQTNIIVSLVIQEKTQAFRDGYEKGLNEGLNPQTEETVDA